MAALAAVLLAQTLSNGAFAAEKRLDCDLTRIQTKSGANLDVATENQSLTILFDEEAKRLVVDRNGRPRKLEHVKITPISMTGYVDDTSLGVDRSSWTIVLQTFASGSISSEFGACRQPEPSP